MIAIKEFDKDKCQLRASALTFYSLLSIVPMAAMAFGIAKGFGFQRILEKELYRRLPGHEDVVEKIIEFANSFLAHAHGGLIAGIGFLFLLWIIIKLLGNVENSFNEIWGIKEARTLTRKFSDYFSFVVTGIVLVVMSSSITVFLASPVKGFVEKFSFFYAVSPIITVILTILPIVIIWFLFTFIYIFMPNTRVRFSSGFLGGVAAGIIYQIVQWIYLTFQIGVSNYSAIYGSFAALPLFLIWIQVSWIIVLFGAEISFAKQNVETYEFERECLEISHSYKLLLTIYITQLCITNFIHGKKPWTPEKISNYTEIPIRLVNQIFYDLTEAKILIEAKYDNTVYGYQPASDVTSMKILNVIESLNSRGVNDIPIKSNKELEIISNRLKSLKELAEKSQDNLNLKDI